MIMLKKVFLGILISMFIFYCPALAQDGGGGSDAPIVAAPGGVKITAIDGEPVTSEECQVSSPEGASGWLPRAAAEELLETLKTANRQKPEGYFSLTCRYQK